MFHKKIVKRINFNEIFPSKLAAVIFLSYMALFIIQGLLVTAVQKSDNTYHFNTASAVLFTEFVKLFASLTIYLLRFKFNSLFEQIKNNLILLWLYFIPSVLYCLYNNLTYVNLSVYDPPTYYLLLQLRVVVTGVVYQIVLRKHLSKTQWFSLILLTIGCMVKEINFDEPQANNSTVHNQKQTGMKFSWEILLILVQILCSCIAGVYNEFLLKKRGENVDVTLQNIFMYSDSTVCSLIFLFSQGKIDLLSDENINALMHYKVLLIIINGAAIGIVTSYFLKYLNSILKTFASALELFFIAVFSWILFDIKITTSTVISITIVSCAIIIYSGNPVKSNNNSAQISTT